MSRAALFVVAICAVACLRADEPAELATAKALDREIMKLKDLPDDARGPAIREMAGRVRRQPKSYIAALAANLAVSSDPAAGREALQEVADTLAWALAESHEQDAFGYDQLAGLVRYSRLKVSFDNPQYAAALSKLEADDRQRAEADFTLTDVQGRRWNLKSMRGRVVLVNFWTTWCPPCRAEAPDLEALYRRFRNKGFVILAITDEEASVVKKFLAGHGLSYPVLLDPGRKVQERFRLQGYPVSLLYDRAGRLVAQEMGRPDRNGFLNMLGQAGLR
jgi:thiol-disulfide isomerase/thioredoxin